MTANDKILDAICYEWGVTLEALRSRRKDRNLSDARLAAGYYLLTEGTSERNTIPTLLCRTRSWSSFALYRAPELAGMDKRFQAKMAAVYERLKAKAA